MLIKTWKPSSFMLHNTMHFVLYPPYLSFRLLCFHDRAEFRWLIARHLSRLNLENCTTRFGVITTESTELQLLMLQKTTYQKADTNFIMPPMLVPPWLVEPCWIGGESHQRSFHGALEINDVVVTEGLRWTLNMIFAFLLYFEKLFIVKLFFQNDFWMHFWSL